MLMQTRPLGYTERQDGQHQIFYSVGLQTVWMPHLTCKLHCRWRKWIVFGKHEIGGEDTALEWRSLGTLYQGFPFEKRVFRLWPRKYSIRWIRAQQTIVVE